MINNVNYCYWVKREGAYRNKVPFHQLREYSRYRSEKRHKQKKKRYWENRWEFTVIEKKNTSGNIGCCSLLSHSNINFVDECDCVSLVHRMFAIENCGYYTLHLFFCALFFVFHSLRLLRFNLRCFFFLSNAVTAHFLSFEFFFSLKSNNKPILILKIIVYVNVVSQSPCENCWVTRRKHTRGKCTFCDHAVFYTSGGDGASACVSICPSTPTHSTRLQRSISSQFYPFHSVACSSP